MKKTAIITVIAVLILASTLLLCVSPTYDENVTAVPPTDDSKWSDYYDTTWYDSAPLATTFTINNEQDLAGLAYIVNQSITDFNGKTINVSASTLDLSAHYWVSIGKSNTVYFSGTFDGGGVVISGLYIGKEGAPSANDYQGLFGWGGANSMIKNVNVIDSAIYAHYAVGAIVGTMFGSISNCSNTGTISADLYGGGIAGGTISPTSLITDCYNTGRIHASASSGGICGEVYGTVENCYNTGEITCGYLGESGGIAGTLTQGLISNCYNTGSIRSNSDDVGGIAGTSHGKIEKCYNTGAISGVDLVGGIVGCLQGSSARVEVCYNTGVVNGSGSYGPIVGAIITGTISNCYWPIELGFSGGISAGQMSGQFAVGRMPGFSSTDWYSNAGVPIVYYDDHYYLLCPQLKVFSGSTNQTKKTDSENSVKITLQKKEVVIVQTGTYEYVQGQKLSAIPPMEITPRGVSGTFAWENGSEILSTTGTLTKKMVFTPDDTLYKITKFDVTITVTGNVPVIASPGTYSYIAGEVLSARTPTEIAPTGIPGTFAWKNGNYSVTTSDMAAAMIFTPNDPRYTSVEFNVTLVVTSNVPTIASPGTYTYVVGEKVSDNVPMETAPTGIFGVFTWKDGNEVLQTIGSTTKVMVFTPNDPRYQQVEYNVSVVVTDRLDVPMITATGIYYYARGETLSARVPTEVAPPGIPGTFAWQNGNDVVAMGDIKKPMVFTPSDFRYKPLVFDADITVVDGLYIPPITQTGTYEYIRDEKLSANVPTEIAPPGIPGTFMWQNGNQIVKLGDTSKPMVFLPSDPRYNPVTFNVTISVIGLSVPSITQTGVYSYIQGEKVSANIPSESSPAGVPGTFSWYSGNEIVMIGDTTKRMVFTPNDARYVPITFNVKITVTGGLSVPSISQTGTYRYVEGERLSVINPSERSPAGIPGTFAWENGGDVLKMDDKSKRMTFTPNDFRYTPITFDVAVIVSDAPEPDNVMLTLLIGCLISAVIGAAIAVTVVMIARRH